METESIVKFIFFIPSLLGILIGIMLSMVLPTCILIWFTRRPGDSGLGSLISYTIFSPLLFIVGVFLIQVAWGLWKWIETSFF